MKTLFSVFTALCLSVGMVGCAKEETPAPADTGTPAATDDGAGAATEGAAEAPAEPAAP